MVVRFSYVPSWSKSVEKAKRIFDAIEVLLRGRYMVKINGKIQMGNVRRGD